MPIKLDCEICGEEISAARLAALPTATRCVRCAAEDDVPRVKGAMSYDHKTAPELVIGKDAEYLLTNSRRGFHAQLPLNGKNNPRMVQSVANFDLSKQIREERPPEDVNLELARFLPARCHPDRERVSVSGLCLDCSLQWYLNRRLK